jgi:hypothetical protein
MGKYVVAHGTFKQAKKYFSGDKKTPGTGDVVEVDDKVAAHLVKAGILAKAKGDAPTSAGKAAIDAKADAKAVDAKGGK